MHDPEEDQKSVLREEKRVYGLIISRMRTEKGAYKLEKKAFIFRDSHFGALKGVGGRLNGALGCRDLFQSFDHEGEKHGTNKENH